MTCALDDSLVQECVLALLGVGQQFGLVLRWQELQVVTSPDGRGEVLPTLRTHTHTHTHTERKRETFTHTNIDIEIRK